MHIKYSPTALKELNEVRLYLQDVSPSGLKNVLSAIRITVNSIPENISIGRSTPHEDVWEKVVPRYGYIIPYTIQDDSVIILRIFNSRRKPLDYEQIAMDIADIQSE